MITRHMKLLTVALSAFFLVLIATYLSMERLYIKNVNMVAREHLQESQDLFNAHVAFDTEKLTAVLSMFLGNEEFKQLFAEGDREKLYKKGLPLYTMLHERHGITHFYFHLPDGTNFLRLHDRQLYGDEIRRETLKTAVVTGKMAVGIELGKTSFALRIVSPYYHGSRLIGYVEIGEEIDHFLDLLQKRKKDVFAILAEKSVLSRDEWIASQKRRGLPADWDVLSHHAWVTFPDQKFLKGRYVTEAAIKPFEYELSIAPGAGDRAGDLIFGGFPLFDIQGKHVGVVVTLMDVSSQMQGLAQLRLMSMIIISVLLLLVMALAGYCVRRRGVGRRWERA
ncbi:cache domain-containing protein [Geobacter sp. DSM 9736]|uniref:cache domain-containing protein n=1 Tax=Geobacter sp. DSM 9736 TaxID=1277350 RepID=UPI0012FD9744|nr:cache domain-containing protein [Geobacter sp. DSM 9736]